MIILNEAVIDRFVHKHPDARGWLQTWVGVTREAEWDSILQMRSTYPSADGGVKVASGGSVTVFNVAGIKYRMIAGVIFSTRTVIVLQLMPHAEYSKGHWKKRF